MTIRICQAAFGYGQQRILSNLDASFTSGVLTAVLGNNGAGKSTLLKGMLGLVPCLQGQVTIDNHALHDLSLEQRACQIAYLEQNAGCHWPLSVDKVIALGRFPRQRIEGVRPLADKEAISKAMALTDVAGLALRPVNQLSGGELARVMLARALATDAPNLLADEPVAGLDPEHQLTVLSQLRDWAGQGRTVVVVLHDINLALRFCARAVLIQPDGGVVEGAAPDVLTKENIQRTFNIKVVSGTHAQQPYLVPWEVDRHRLPEHQGAASDL